ncbi:hypothetical protein HPB50_022545 [Hyalomma asiaticum]|uniref:Uncharacterized protein n=1 Tax=Hyalomma asiaticum TaxID=266040 RepID=A0ACB7S370_HYAAI|nr:hypothetical protein HPB50_022545 [Hyalomma asiaticum]
MSGQQRRRREDEPFNDLAQAHSLLERGLAMRAPLGPSLPLQTAALPRCKPFCSAHCRTWLAPPTGSPEHQESTNKAAGRSAGPSKPAFVNSCSAEEQRQRPPAVKTSLLHRRRP